MWKYTRVDGWQRIENLFTDTPSIEEQLPTLGFDESPSIDWKAVDGTMKLEVNCRDRAIEQPDDVRYEYIADVGVGHEINLVAIPTLPDLLALLRELAPVFTADAQLGR